MLRLLLHRYGVYQNYRVDFCYDETPPSKAKERRAMLDEARARQEGVWLQHPGVIVGMGWMACELLIGVGKTKLKDKTGTKWHVVSDIIERTAWITYDPDSCLYDPALVVDIAAVVVAAGKEADLPMSVEKNEALNQMNSIWKRYL
jgi:hypothetical protein